MIDDIPNLRKVSSKYWTGGQPSEDQLAALKAEGFERILNLAPQDPRYSLKDEAGCVASLGMKYELIAIDFKNPKLEDYDRFEKSMLRAGDERVFIHCAANYRVTTVFGCFAVSHLGWSEEEWTNFIADVWDISEVPVWSAFKAELKLRVREFAK